MEKSIISEGKTTTEAIEKGLASLKVTKDMVDIKVLESEEKRSFFSILAPRVVKVELTIKENVTRKKEKTEDKRSMPRKYTEREHEVKKIQLSSEEAKQVVDEMTVFLTTFFKNLKREDVVFEVKVMESYIAVNITGEKLNYLIGYRGETLNAFQVILTSIASKYSKEKLRILLDIENYREKREKSLEELAEKIAKTVMKTRKAITLEPMTSYERKVIHSKLQEHPNVKTYSTGTEPYRKVVVALK